MKCTQSFPPSLFLYNPSSSSSIVAEKILLPFTHPLPLSSISLVFLITHTPRCGPSLGSFEVILAQILLSYTGDKTRTGLRLRASGNVSFCWLNHQCLLFHLCLHLSQCVCNRTDFQGVYVLRNKSRIVPIPCFQIVSLYMCLHMVYVCVGACVCGK